MFNHKIKMVVAQMASYSMTLRECLQTLLMMNGTDYSSMTTKEFIEEGRKVLFDYDYGIYDPLYRGVFETKFIRNFYMREIGFETESLFKFQLETWLLINMAYFNKMFESELIDFDPLVNSEMKSDASKTKDTDGTINTTTNGNTTSTNKQNVTGTQSDSTFNRGLESDTPDSRLAITTQDGSGVIEYASKIAEDKLNRDATSTNNVDGTNTDTTNGSGNTLTDITETETYLQNRTGKIGSITYSKMLMEYRDSLIRIERKMFDEMQQLFMLVY